MNRTFHARINWYQYIYLLLVVFLASWMLWIKAIIPAVLLLILLIIIIERFIHTTYTLTTDNKLIIYEGRFAKTRTIALESIHYAERRQSHFGKLTRTTYILIQYGLNKYTSVLPVNEKEFIELLDKKRYDLHNPL